MSNILPKSSHGRKNPPPPPPPQMDQAEFRFGGFRSVYDIMHLADQRGLSSLLPSVDFEKAFDCKSLFLFVPMSELEYVRSVSATLVVRLPSRRQREGMIAAVVLDP